LSRGRWIRWRNPRGPRARRRFGTRRPSRKDLFACARILRATINCFERIHLRRREAVGSVCVFAQQDCRIEAACPWVAQKAVFQAILAVACRKHAVLNRRQFCRGDAAARTLQQCLLIPDEACEQVRPIARGSAGKDSVKVFGIPLCFHQSLAAAIGTSGKIAQRRVAAIESADDRFGLNARFMYRTIAEIDELFGMTDGPGRTSAPFVAVIGASGRVTSN